MSNNNKNKMRENEPLCWVCGHEQKDHKLRGCYKVINIVDNRAKFCKCPYVDVYKI